jgi:soluble lytic murein transglycosylase-like protein
MSFNQYDQIVQAASVNYNVSVPLIKAVIMTESSFNPTAVRHERRADGTIWDSSRGLMQLLFRTAVSLGFPNDAARANELFDPAININYGTKLLAQIQGRYENVDDIYAVYNSGAVRKNSAGEYVNTTGDTGVQKRVDRFLSIYSDFLTEWEETAAAIQQSEAEVEGGGTPTSGQADPATMAGLVLAALLGYLAYKTWLS